MRTLCTMPTLLHAPCAPAGLRHCFPVRETEINYRKTSDAGEKRRYVRRQAVEDDQHTDLCQKRA